MQLQLQDTTNEIHNYIRFRYDNWLQYAEYMAKTQGFKGWEYDLLNDVLANLLEKPIQKLAEMVSRNTRKIVNGIPTTELDKFVLRMLNINAKQPTAPFRKNTLGRKIISRAEKKIKTPQLTQIDKHSQLSNIPDDDGYDFERCDRLDNMHRENMSQLKDNDYSTETVSLYRKHYIDAEPVKSLSDKERKDINKMTRFLMTKWLHMKKAI